MSVNTIVTSPSGGRTASRSSRRRPVREALELARDPPLLLDDTEPRSDGSVHDELDRGILGLLLVPVADDDDEREVNMAVLESPCMDERRVMISRKVGRMVGSWCQHETIRST
jgi:hypothetical protein